MPVFKVFVALPALLAVVLMTQAAGLTSRDYFDELRQAGGVHPLAELVCFPEGTASDEGTFVLVGFSNHLARTLRAKGESVAKEFVNAEAAPESERFVMQWAFHNGVALGKEPETLSAVVGTKGSMWSGEYPPDPKAPGRHLALRMVFAMSGRYSRDVLVNGAIAKSIYGKCEPLQ